LGNLSQWRNLAKWARKHRKGRGGENFALRGDAKKPTQGGLHIADGAKSLANVEAAGVQPALLLTRLLVGRLREVVRLLSTLLPGVGVCVALGAIVIKVGVVGCAANVPLHISPIFADVWLNVGLRRGSRHDCASCYQNNSRFHIYP